MRLGALVLLWCAAILGYYKAVIVVYVVAGLSYAFTQWLLQRLAYRHQRAVRSLQYTNVLFVLSAIAVHVPHVSTPLAFLVLGILLRDLCVWRWAVLCGEAWAQVPTLAEAQWKTAVLIVGLGCVSLRDYLPMALLLAELLVGIALLLALYSAWTYWLFYRLYAPKKK